MKGPIPSVLVQKFVTFRTPLQSFRQGALSAVMLSHHKGWATLTEGSARAPKVTFPVLWGRHRCLAMRDIAYATLPTQRTGNEILNATNF
jgi:hypothetical protein